MNEKNRTMAILLAAWGALLVLSISLAILGMVNSNDFITMAGGILASFGSVVFITAIVIIGIASIILMVLGLVEAVLSAWQPWLLFLSIGLLIGEASYLIMIFWRTRE